MLSVYLFFTIGKYNRYTVSTSTIIDEYYNIN